MSIYNYIAITKKEQTFKEDKMVSEKCWDEKGEKIEWDEEGRPLVPDNPTIPYIVGDGTSAAGPGQGLMAPRVGIAAHPLMIPLPSRFWVR